MNIGDLVEAGGSGGRVTALRGNMVEVELYDRPGFRFWFKIEDVRIGSPCPRPTMMSGRYSKKEKTVEVRAVCRHLNIADMCNECNGGLG